MKLYVVIRNIEYEGCDTPLGIYSSEARAKAKIAWWKRHNPGRGSVPDIYEYELDAGLPAAETPARNK